MHLTSKHALPEHFRPDLVSTEEFSCCLSLSLSLALYSHLIRVVRLNVNNDRLLFAQIVAFLNMAIKLEEIFFLLYGSVK